MLETVVHQPPHVDGYDLIERQQIPIRRVAVIGLLSAPIWVALFIGATRAFGGSYQLALHVTFVGVVVAILNLSVFMPAVHEAVHGVVARLCGANPTFGIGSGFAYTTFREPVRPIPYLLIGLAPIVVLSAAGLILLVIRPVAPGQTMIFMVGNATGAFGDLWVAVRVLRLPRGSLVCDLADGFAYYLPAADQMTPS